MANTYHQIYLQVVFAVKYRAAIIDPTWRSQLFAVIGNLINECSCKTIIVNGIEDHVHCLFSLQPSISIAELMKNVKAKSSKFVNDQALTRHRFNWQNGYGAFSYGKSQINDVVKYIQNQEEHHRTFTFQEEYKELLHNFNINFEDQYLFQDLE